MKKWCSYKGALFDSGKNLIVVGQMGGMRVTDGGGGGSFVLEINSRYSFDKVAEG